MSVRVERVGNQIRRILSEMVVSGEIRDPGLSGALVTLTEVRVSRDLSLATIFFAVSGGAEVEQQVEAALNRAAGFMRTRVGQEMRLRLVPQLRFLVDRSVEQGQRIEELLKSLNIPPADDTAS
ncbi:MAG: 30S ribosome-binding factor RbfA [Magnetococcales bacterium]|nr:30S ribosome-binding factor RbfA [Magnetococcales bacterium]